MDPSASKSCITASTPSLVSSASSNSLTAERQWARMMTHAALGRKIMVAPPSLNSSASLASLSERFSFKNLFASMKKGFEASDDDEY
ncbi:hypothetical protein BCR33DRAFT_718872 [Rhizoclosmatium globosum]|uniref:Uncharacterized protein n=1 Tax=Rhizoclosmatium globosum TaxID=329046 RepID=A0A1Y2C2T8_9FUNG|nr:hypothetical protein BCR33DRAFT_718872 [Rhizoclosmatium globosum]|eukprot:ORY41207.1 hypothetical protein BCR33DRAFT_718872 [Rhizoclosmatium globosum]